MSYSLATDGLDLYVCEWREGKPPLVTRKIKPWNSLMPRPRQMRPTETQDGERVPMAFLAFGKRGAGA